jgi:hypothetical protein
MTNQQHPIVPPPERLDKWNNLSLSTEEIFVIAAQWGADQELEACCEWLRSQHHSDTWPSRLRAARRPKPPSLKEQAFKALGPEPLPVTAPMGDTILNKNIIERHRLLHRALEALPND